MTTNIYSKVRRQVLDALRESYPNIDKAVFEKIEQRTDVFPAKNASFGDISSNVAMIAAPFVAQSSMSVSGSISTNLQMVGEFDNVTSAKPGFVNLRLRHSDLLSEVREILICGEAYGDSTVGAGVPTNVEYVSANPTGPMHVGHCRGAVVGDALANLLAKAGFAVTKEYYINDAGNQVVALAWAAYWRYLQALGTTMTEEEFSEEVPGGLQYRGEYLVEVGRALASECGASLAGENLTIASPHLWLDRVRSFTVDAMMRSIREDLSLLGVEQDVFSSERALAEAGATEKTIALLRANGLIYEGVLEPPKGKTPEDWEPREQTLFRATQFGDDVDRPLKKSDGSATYFANDIAYHADKISRGAKVMIDIWGADHGGYVSRMQSAVRALGGKLEIVLCQIVHVLKDGQPVRMSKRAGTYITLRDLIDEVGRDAVRFTMLTRKSDAQMEFDIAAAVAQTRDNPVFYVQYAHARCRSVLRAAAEQFGAGRATDAALATIPLDSLENEAELALIRRLLSWPRLVEGAALAREPHRIAFFLYDLAGDFHMLWNRGKDDAALRFLQADRPAESLARVALVAATAVVIRSGLAVMGVTPVEEMR